MTATTLQMNTNYALINVTLWVHAETRLSKEAIINDALDLVVDQDFYVDGYEVSPEHTWVDAHTNADLELLKPAPKSTTTLSPDTSEVIYSVLKEKLSRVEGEAFGGRTVQQAESFDRSKLRRTAELMKAIEEFKNLK